MLAGDFIMDADGDWWLTQVKAFEVRDDVIFNTVENKESVTHLTRDVGLGCLGDYCSEVMSSEDRMLYPEPENGADAQKLQLTYKDILLDRVLQKVLKANAATALEQSNKRALRQQEHKLLLSMHLGDQQLITQVLEENVEMEAEAAMDLKNAGEC